MSPFHAAVAAAIHIAQPGMAAEQRYGPWEVRRARVRNPKPSHGFPDWRVTFSGPEESPTVSIDGDRSGKAGGYVLVGRRVTVDARADTTLDFSYETYCALGHRSGSVSMAIFEPAAWDGLGREGKTSVQLGASPETSALCSWSVHSMQGPDVTEPRPLPDSLKASFAKLLRVHAGRQVVVSVQWTAPHSCEERAKLTKLRLATSERVDPVQALLAKLDIPATRDATARGDYDAASRLVLEHFRKRFPLPDEKPKPKKELLAEANAALDNRFRSAGSDEFIALGDDIDWTRCPIDDRQWLLHLHWHGFMVTLAEAHAATGDGRYAQRAAELLRDWIEKNPVGTAWGWGTLHTALRAMKWLRAYPWLVHAECFTSSDNVMMLTSLAEHAEFLLPEARHRPGHNFGTTQSFALTRLGLRYPEFRRAKLWRDTGWGRMEKEIHRSVLDDGAQVELTTSYHQSVMNTFMRSGEIVEAAGLKPSADYWKRVEKMHEYTMFLTMPDGFQPALGDAGRGEHNWRLLRGARRFNRDDMLYVATRGKEGRKPDHLDAQLPSAGYYVMRTDWIDPDAMYVMVDVAHHWGGWHQHFDTLQVILYAYGRTLMPDAGAYTYSQPQRDPFQATHRHSTITIDGQNQNTSPAKLHCRFSSDALSFIDGSHRGYKDVVHRRQVLFARPADKLPAYIVVIDRVTGEGEHLVDQSFHLFPATARFDQAACELRTTAGDGANILVRGLATPGLLAEQAESSVSFRYSRKQARPAVRFRRTGSLPMLFVTLIVPFRGAGPPDLKAELVRLGGSAVGARVVGTTQNDIIFAALEPSEITLDGRPATARAGLWRRRTTDGAARTVTCAE